METSGRAGWHGRETVPQREHFPLWTVVLPRGSPSCAAESNTPESASERGICLFVACHCCSLSCDLPPSQIPLLFRGDRPKRGAHGNRLAAPLRQILGTWHDAAVWKWRPPVGP